MNKTAGTVNKKEVIQNCMTSFFYALEKSIMDFVQSLDLPEVRKSE